MKHTLTTILVAAGLGLALTGCSVSQPTTVIAPAPSEVTMVATLAITGPAGYRVQSTLTAWNKADIDHVTLTLYKRDGAGAFVATGATKTVANADLAAPISLGNLKMASDYQIVARAYADALAQTAIDNIAESGSQADCSVSFTTPSLTTSANGDSISTSAHAVTIPVKLKNKTFAGQASSGGVSVTNGTIVNTSAAETF